MGLQAAVREMRYPIGIRSKWKLEQLNQIISIPIKMMLTYNLMSVDYTLKK